MTLQRIGNYELLGELGRGGMGVVYRGVDSYIQRQVAIKTIYLTEIQDEHERQFLKQSLYREAKSAGILSHPNIVTIYQIGEQDDITYIAMEFVDGPNLAQLLRQQDRPSLETLLRIFEQTAAGLDHAHSQGVIHRDIKPANVLVREDGVAKITDFGVAKISSQTVTRTGMTLGTPHFMAPEQIQGKRVDGKADQYSLGVLMYEIITGKKPFTADSMTTLIFKIVSDEVVPKRDNPELSPATCAVLRRALAKNPADRFPNCAALARALRGALETDPAALTWNQPKASGSTPHSLGSAGVAPSAELGSVVGQTGHGSWGPPATTGAVNAPPPPTTAPQPSSGVTSQSSSIYTAPGTSSTSTSNGKKWLAGLLAFLGLGAVLLVLALVGVFGGFSLFRSGNASDSSSGNTTSVSNSTESADAPAAGESSATSSKTAPHQTNPGIGDTSSGAAASGSSSTEQNGSGALSGGGSGQPASTGTNAGNGKPSGSGSKTPAGSGSGTSSGAGTAGSGVGASATGASVTGGASGTGSYGTNAGGGQSNPSGGGAGASQPSGASGGSTTGSGDSGRNTPTVTVAPKPLVRVPAVYPASARREGVSGTVGLRATINRNGEPTNIEVVKGIRPDLDQAAVAALSKWRFQPGTVDGQPVEAKVNVEIAFNLVQDQRKPVSLRNP